jgi:BirA family transcriptional regulator, biotin operon repressor / biotin---[acetyl-CoA-carboxylase] ligase
MAAHKIGDLDLSLLQNAAEGQLIGSHIEILTQTSSTNDEVLQRARREAGEGLVIFANEQTAGRGQHGNKWESPAGKALLFSVLVKPRLALTESARLTQWAAQAVATSIQQLFSIDARIKPPNDIHIRDRKVAGVLAEMRAQERGPHIAVVGIGVNVNQEPDDFSIAIRGNATSLAIATGKSVDRHRVAIALLRELERTYALAFEL